MVNFLFYVFSAFALLAGLLIVLSRNAVNSAMFMILSCIGIAGLFLLLDAPLLAILEILVYAGAIMVLFLFIIMLLNVDKSASAKPNPIALVASIVSFVILIIGVNYCFISHSPLPFANNPLFQSINQADCLVVACHSTRCNADPLESIDSSSIDSINHLSSNINSVNDKVVSNEDFEGVFSIKNPLTYTHSLKTYGYALFSKYMLPFQVAGILLLMGIVGVVVISKAQKQNDYSKQNHPS